MPAAGCQAAPLRQAICQEFGLSQNTPTALMLQYLAAKLGYASATPDFECVLDHDPAAAAKWLAAAQSDLASDDGGNADEDERAEGDEAGPPDEVVLMQMRACSKHAC